MTKEETLELMAILKAAYPNSYNGMTKQEAIGVVTVWHLHFSSVPADIVFMALQKAISSSKFPPSINEVKGKLQSVYWEAYEAYEALDSYGYVGTPPPGERAALLRICEETKLYKHARMVEPTVQQMLYSAPPAGPGLAEGPANKLGGPQ